MISFKLTQDNVSPALARLAATARNPEPVLRAMGTTFKSLTEGTFNSAGAAFRPKPWPPKKDGTPSNLQLTTTLAKSFQLEVTSTYARVSTGVTYSRIHQLGSAQWNDGIKFIREIGGKRARTEVRKGIPPRPFFPVINGRLTPEAERLIGRAGARVIARQAGQIV